MEEPGQREGKTKKIALERGPIGTTVPLPADHALNQKDGATVLAEGFANAKQECLKTRWTPAVFDKIHVGIQECACTAQTKTKVHDAYHNTNAKVNAGHTDRTVTQIVQTPTHHLSGKS